MQTLDQDSTHRLLGALGEQLADQGTRIELVVLGGSALLALGLISRTTRDVDILGLFADGDIVDPRPLPDALTAASARVARDFDLPRDWLNAAPAALLDLGLPHGLSLRLERRSYGTALTVHFVSRLDQIHFKLYAMVDQGAGKHEADLRALRPTNDELIQAARWVRTHDPSEGFRLELVTALAHLGVEDADLDA